MYFKREEVFALQHNNSISFYLSGRFALFSDPITRVGGEKFSYPVPTYQALKGIFESVYWKPTFIWYPDAIRVMNPIETQSKGIRPIRYNDGTNDLSIYTYLVDVCYQVRGHFEWNLNRPDQAADRNENKHYFIAKRMLERGGRRDIFLGIRECQGYVEPCEFGEGKGAYDDSPALPLGLMLHGITYADEDGSGMMSERLWRPVMERGIIQFIRPEECPIIRPIHKQKEKSFVIKKNIQPCEELYREVKTDELDRTLLSDI